VLQMVGRLLDVAQDAGAKVGAQNNMNPYYYYRYGINPGSGLVRFVLETSTSSRRMPTRKPLTTRDRADGWRG